MDITDYGLYSACGDCFIVYQANEREQHFYYLYPGYDTAAILASTPFYSNETSKTGAFVSVDTLFEYDYQTASLKTRNLLTGEENVLTVPLMQSSRMMSIVLIAEDHMGNTCFTKHLM